MRPELKKLRCPRLKENLCLPANVTNVTTVVNVNALTTVITISTVTPVTTVTTLNTVTTVTTVCMSFVPIYCYTPVKDMFFLVCSVVYDDLVTCIGDAKAMAYLSGKGHGKKIT